ncbi:unnamed protein product [Discosporangium mesarthrocarpum]
MPSVMAGDVGGTNSRFMLYEVSGRQHMHQGKRAPGKLIHCQSYPNENVSSFCVQVETFLKDAGCTEPPMAACFAIAGPVSNNKVVMTNRNWVVDGSEVSGAGFNIGEVRLINDFVAAGYGLLTLDIEVECVTVQSGVHQKGAPIACIGSGTGLGETFLTCPVRDLHSVPRDNNASGVDAHLWYDAWPTEGGHAELAPRNDLEYEFIQYMKKVKGVSRVSVERLVSGSGLANLYDFLSEKFPERVDQATHAAYLAAGDMRGKVIAEAASTPGSICNQVMEIWATHYGSEAGVAGLKHLPLGGIFLAGGMTPKNIHLIQGTDSPFIKAFYDKGRVSSALRNVPIYAVMEENIGQRGAHYVAFSMYENTVAKEMAVAKQRDTDRATARFVFAMAASAIAGALVALTAVRVVGAGAGKR